MISAGGSHTDGRRIYAVDAFLLEMTAQLPQSRPSSLPKDLPAELWKLILSYIEPDYEQAIPIDKAIASRQFLSVESFVPPDPRDSIANVGRHSIGRLRLVCRGLAEVGAPFQFTQLVVRFSQKGLRRLDNISQCAHLARLVRRFTCTYIKGRKASFSMSETPADFLPFAFRHGTVLLRRW